MADREPGKIYLRNRFDLRIQDVARNQRSLKESVNKYDKKTFADAWKLDVEQSSVELAAIERFYERVVNALQEAFDLARKDLVKADKFVSAEDPSSRWDHLVAQRRLTRSEADTLERICALRDIPFAHLYPDWDRSRGPEIFELMQDLVTLAPKTSLQIVQMYDAITP